MLTRFLPVVLLTAICWVVFLLDHFLWNGHLAQFGIIPRHVAGLNGILWAPFLHASYHHLAANTLPLLGLGGILCARSRREFAVVTVAGTLLGGAFTWVFARSASHIGASGLIFCYFGYLASLALFQRTFGTLALSVMCVLLYGGMLKGVLPTATPISWESHASGFGAGLLLAWLAAKVKKAPEAATSPAPENLLPH